MALIKQYSKIYKSLLVLMFLAVPLSLYSQVETYFNGIKMNEDKDSVIHKMNEVSKRSILKSVDDPRFPLAVNKEEHLVCLIVDTNHGIIERVVFTFADDSLKYIEAKGNIEEAIISNLNETPTSYFDYSIYNSINLFVKSKEDTAWFLSQEALDCNLFLWENPYLEINKDKQIDNDFFSDIPGFLKMGSTLQDMTTILERHSNFLNIEKLDGKDPNAQIQINCFGVNYFGFPRKVEARFGNNRLNVVWILTAKEEEGRIRKSLIEQFGEPIFINNEWEIFDDWQVGLRKDKPEVLLMEKSVGLEYKTSYFKQF